MIFEWDEAKNRINREKHGPDFDAVFTFEWANALVADRTRRGDGEPRFAAFGLICGKIHPDHKPATIPSERGKSL